LRRHFRLLLGIAVVCEGLPTSLDIYFGRAQGGRESSGLGILSRLLGLVGSVLVRGATIWVVSEGYLGRTPRLAPALRFTGQRMPRLVGASVAAGLATGVATLALVVPGIIVASGFAVVTEVAALERSGDALRRSWHLTQGFRWKALGLWAIALAVLAGLAIGTGVLATRVEALLGNGEPISTVVVALVSLLFYPLLSCVFTLFYYDLRVRKEGYDLEMLSQHLGDAAPAQ
jgi:hypothetical protein